MDKLNFSPIKNDIPFNQQNVKNETINKNETCFDDADWCDNAANAIGIEFEDMDSFLDKFTKSQNFM